MIPSSRTPHVRIVLGVTALAGAIGLAACGDSGPSDPGSCEVVASTQAQGADPSTGIRIINRLNGGASATVSSSSFADIEADLGAGECNIVGIPAGDYDVSMQQCEQSISGSTECTSSFGVEVVLQVTLAENEIRTIEITNDLF